MKSWCIDCVITGVCLSAAHAAIQTDFAASVDAIFRKESLEISNWKVYDDQIENLNFTYTGSLPLHDVASGILLNSTGGIMGESFLLRAKANPSRIVNVNLRTNGEGFVLIQDKDASRSKSPRKIELPAVSSKLASNHNSCGVNVHSTTPPPSNRTSKGPSAKFKKQPSARDYELPDGERDGAGTLVVDALFIFSLPAQQFVEETFGMSLEEYAALQQLFLHTAWENSGITGVRVRIVDTQVWEPDVAVTVDNAYWVRDMTVEAMDDIGADVVAYFTTGTQFGTSDASGYAGIEEPWSLQLVDGVTNWRHEVGHNAGLAHCWVEEEGDDGFAYKHGWTMPDMSGDHDGVLGTIMCGNSVSVFSNPGIEWGGAVVGDEEHADATRQWIDYAPLMSGRRAHKVPYEDEGEPSYTVVGSMTHYTPQDNILIFDVAEGTDKFIFRTFSGDIRDPLNLYSVFIDSNCCPGVYWGNHRPQTSHLFIFDCPAAGEWSAFIGGSGPTNFTISVYLQEGSSRKCHNFRKPLGVSGSASPYPHRSFNGSHSALPAIHEECAV